LSVPEGSVEVEIMACTFRASLKRVEDVEIFQVCALCIEKKKKAPSRRGKQTTYKCKQCDLPLCRVGCFWNTTSSEMWRCKIRPVGYYMHKFVTNKMRKELSFHLFYFNCYDFFFRGGETCFWCSR